MTFQEHSSRRSIRDNKGLLTANMNMNFIKHRALLDKEIDDLIESRERVFNKTLQDMLAAAVAN